jgi:hypothetical protein
MPDDWKEFEPQDRASLLPADPLMTFLQAHRDVPVRLSLAQQKRTDSRLVQMMLTATKAWGAKGLGFDVTNLPPRLGTDYARLGLNGETTGWSGLK